MSVSTGVPLASLKPILSSKVTTFTVNANGPGAGINPTDKVDLHIVYYSNGLDSENGMRFKTLDFSNKESILKAKEIFNAKLLAGIELRNEGICLTLHSQLSDKLVANAPIYIESKGHLILIGKLSCVRIVEDNVYNRLGQISEFFLKCVKFAIENKKS